MKLSIITINYNNLEGLKKTVESVLAQTWRDFEWIIVDGGSTDGSREYIESLAQSLSEGTAIDRVQWNVERFSLPGFTADDLKNPEVAQSSNCLSSIANRQSSIANRSQRFLWCSEPDKGVYNAMNKGIVMAQGEYLNFMNSGDSYVDEFILLKVFNITRLADVLYGDTLYEIENGAWRTVLFDKDIDKWYFARLGWINHQSAFIKRALCVVNPYDESYKICADTNFFFHLAINGALFEHLETIVSKFEYGGISNNTWENPKETIIYLESNLRVMLSLEDRNLECNSELIFDKEILNAIYRKKTNPDYYQYEDIVSAILTRLFSQGHNGVQWFNIRQLLATDSYLQKFFPKVYVHFREKEIFIHAMTRKVPFSQFRRFWWRFIILYPRNFIKEAIHQF